MPDGSGGTLRLAAVALAWMGAGALGHAANGSLRFGIATGLLALLGLWLALPLLRRAGTPVPPGPAAAAPAPDEPAPDPRRQVQLEAWLEHLPVAAWVQAGDRLQPLGSRARRLAAPGAVRDGAALRRLLGTATGSGPVVLDTERGSERWQLLHQPLALDGRQQTLLVLVPLERALEFETLVAWQQLVQVLTHEIMNSLTPIRSLSQTAQSLLDEPDAGDELRQALDAIARRAESLSSFVTTYRRVGQAPAPVMAPVDLRALFGRLQQAVGPAWAARGGEARFALESPSLRLQADEGQLEQALLALLSNAEHATAGLARPGLWVQGRETRGGRLQISVRDNGPGVPAGLERQIFLPFFSAREGGQGIGLTVVRQLAHGMGARVRHVRPVEGGAAFVLSF